MKNFTKKGILQKTIIVILMVLTLNFIVPTYSQADFGGALLSPIVDLLCSVGDAVVNLLQVCLGGGWSGSGAPDFSFNAFMVEDDEFFAGTRTSDFKAQGLIVDSIPEGATSETIDVDAPNDKGFEKGWLGTSNKYHVPISTFSPEQIFAGNVPGLDINFINPNEYEDKNGNAIESSASQLQPTIATWYVALRNLTVVGLLSVLVYVGIRIIMSSAASDKAKYKQMLMDWLIALCLVFFLHYIMSFVLTMTESICSAIAGSGDNNIYVEVVSEDNQSGIFTTNLLGLARFKTQYSDFGQKMAYLIMYLALVIYTVLFTWFYLKRLLMMAFLTLIAPVVALTYPIDKISDGKAQAFDSWLKEYVFNALIQPFHLIIYTVFVGSAMDLATTNIIYMIAALGFIFPAEKILRKFFGFEKAGAGTLGALAGGFTAANLLKGLGKGKGGGSGKVPGGKQNSEGDKPPRFENKHDISEIGDGSSNNTGNNNPEETESNIHDRAAEMLAEEEKNMTAQDYRESGMKPQEWRENRQKELEEQLRKEENSQKQTQGQNEQKNLAERAKELAKHTGRGALNLARAHNITPRGIGRGIAKGGLKAIKGVAKFGTRTAFRAAAGALPAAIALASGGGLAGASAAFMATSSLADRASNKVIDAVGNAPATFRREVDTFNGNTNMQDKAAIKEWKKDENNLQFLKDQMASQNGGNIPSIKQVKDKMNSFDPYLAEGLTDIKDMLKAQKAESYGISSKQAAIIAAIGKERGITADILNDSKKAEAHQANLKQDFINKGYSQADAAKQANYTMNVWKVQNGVAHNMQKPQQSKTVQPPKQSKPPRTKK